jgi:hypothetical protein
MREQRIRRENGYEISSGPIYEYFYQQRIETALQMFFLALARCAFLTLSKLNSR